MIGAIQWAASLGRIGANTSVMTLASFRAEPRQGHFDSCKIVASYSSKLRWDAIRLRTEEPESSSMPAGPCDWEESFHGKFKELTPHSSPVSLGKHVLTISYYEANLFQNFMTGGSFSVVLHMLNKTPVDWHSKKESTVETATRGSE